VSRKSDERCDNRHHFSVSRVMRLIVK